MAENMNENINENINRHSRAAVIVKTAIIPVVAYLIWRYVINYGVQYIASYIVSAKLISTHPDASYDELNDYFFELIYRNISLIYIIASAIFVIAFIIIERKLHITRRIGIHTRRINLKRGVTAFFIGTFTGVFFNLGLALVEKHLPKSWVDANAESVQAFDGGSIILSLIATVICAPIVEELLFRGLLYNAVKKIAVTVPGKVTRNVHIISIAAATVTASVLFGLYHENILQAIYAGLLSLFMIWLYETGGSLILGMIFHGAFNFSGITAALMESYMGSALALIISAILTAVLMIAEHSFCNYKSETEGYF